MIFTNCAIERCFFFFFNDTATTEIYTSFPTRRSSDLLRSIKRIGKRDPCEDGDGHHVDRSFRRGLFKGPDRKSTRLNSSHLGISYAVFCLKKKNRKHNL